MSESEKPAIVLLGIKSVANCECSLTPYYHHVRTLRQHRDLVRRAARGGRERRGRRQRREVQRAAEASEGAQGGGGAEGARGGGAPSSGGAAEGGGGEAQGRGAGQKTCKSFLFCYDGADGFRRRRSLRNSAEKARRRRWRRRIATGVRSAGSSANSGLVSRPRARSVARRKPSASGPARRSRRGSASGRWRRSPRRGQAARRGRRSRRRKGATGWRSWRRCWGRA